VIRGLAATVAMSSTFLARPRLPPPPMVVSENLARGADADPSGLATPARHAGWIAAHLGFGVSLSLAHELLPRPRSSVLFGVGVWLASYGVALPALGLYPRADRDDRVRCGAGIVAHVIFGTLLGASR
jgi:hypothetical protein